MKIICTSTGCLDYAPDMYAEAKKDIDIIRIHMFFQGKEYLEGIGFAPEDFYKTMERVKDVKGNLPHTAMPTVEEIREVFDRAVAEGHKEAIVIALSSYLGGTWNLIRIVAAEYKGKMKIAVVDARITCFQEGQLALFAKKLADEGKDMVTILREIEWRKAHQEFIGVSGKLDYMILNGRLKGGKAFMGKAINICPVVHFNHAGELTSFSTAIGINGALKKSLIQLEKWIGDRASEDYDLYRTYTGTTMIPKQLNAESKFSLKTNHPDVIMSCVTGIHVGPWTIGYAYMPKRREDEELPPLDDEYKNQLGLEA